MLTPYKGFAGGPLSDATGDFLAEAGVKLRSIYGATEFGVTSHVKPTRDEDWKEWRWIELDANARLAWDKQSDGTEELLVLVRWGTVFIMALGDSLTLSLGWRKPLAYAGRVQYAEATGVCDE